MKRFTFLSLLGIFAYLCSYTGCHAKAPDKQAHPFYDLAPSHSFEGVRFVALPSYGINLQEIPKGYTTVLKIGNTSGPKCSTISFFFHPKLC